jgi:hypothetical protein
MHQKAAFALKKLFNTTKKKLNKNLITYGNTNNGFPQLN